MPAPSYITSVPPTDPDELAGRYLDLWQDQVAAMAQDPAPARWPSLPVASPRRGAAVPSPALPLVSRRRAATATAAATASWTWMSALGTLPRVAAGAVGWHRSLEDRGREIAQALGRDFGPSLAAVTRAARERMVRLAGAALAYESHPWRRDHAEAPALFEEGATCLRDYGPAGGRPVLVVPSLINRFYILDLAPDTSLVRYLSGRGLRCLVVDWGLPGAAEHGFGIADYVARLERLLDRVMAAGGGPVGLMGYCLGGLLALALAARRPDAVARLALLATPWEFHAWQTPGRRALAGRFAAMVQAAGVDPVPGWALQMLFQARDPILAVRKYLGFAALDAGSPRARTFVATEDWANDAVPLAAEVARACFGDLYHRNDTGRGVWQVGGRAVRPEALTVPTLAMLPLTDTLVPQASSEPLADAISGAVRRHVAAGHVGMVVGRVAQAQVWQPLQAWFSEPSL